MMQYEENLVGIPIVALEELDTFKRETTERGYSAREVSRRLDALRERGSLKEGVRMNPVARSA